MPQFVAIAFMSGLVYYFYLIFTNLQSEDLTYYFFLLYGKSLLSRIHTSHVYVLKLIVIIFM